MGDDKDKLGMTSAERYAMAHAQATQLHVHEVILGGTIEIKKYVDDADAELAKAIAHETDRRDEEDGGLTQRIDELTKRVAALEAKPAQIVHDTSGGPCE